MSEQSHYLNREIDEKLSNLQTSMDKGFEGVIKRLDYTNGKVQKNSEWRIYTAGALSIISLVVLPILYWAVVTLVNIDDHIDQALQAYEIKYEETNN